MMRGFEGRLFLANDNRLVHARLEYRTKHFHNQHALETCQNALGYHILSELQEGLGGWVPCIPTA